MRRMVIALLALLAAAPAFGAEMLKLCYSGSFLITVGEACITYSPLGDDAVSVHTVVNTVPPVSYVHPMKEYGDAVIGTHPLVSRSMTLLQTGGKKNTYHSYQFYPNQLQWRIEKMVVKTGKITSEKEGTEEGQLLDPYGGAFMIQLSAHLGLSGTVRVFYDGKVVAIPYEYLGKDKVKAAGERFVCDVIEFVPNFKMNDEFVPQGKWKVWVDERSRALVQIKVGFTVGHATFELESIDGDRELIPRIFDESAMNTEPDEEPVSEPDLQSEP